MTVRVTYDASGKVLARTDSTDPSDPTYRPEDRNRGTLDSALDAALGGLRAFIDQAKPTTTAAQANAAYDATKLLCRVAVAVIRLMRSRLDATD